MWEACTRHVLEVRKRDSRLEEEALQSWVAESGDMVSGTRQGSLGGPAGGATRGALPIVRVAVVPVVPVVVPIAGGGGWVVLRVVRVRRVRAAWKGRTGQSLPPSAVSPGARRAAGATARRPPDGPPASAIAPVVLPPTGRGPVQSAPAHHSHRRPSHCSRVHTSSPGK